MISLTPSCPVATCRWVSYYTERQENTFILQCVIFQVLYTQMSYFLGKSCDTHNSCEHSKENLSKYHHSSTALPEKACHPHSDPSWGGLSGCSPYPPGLKGKEE